MMSMKRRQAKIKSTTPSDGWVSDMAGINLGSCEGVMGEQDAVEETLGKMPIYS